MVSNPLDFKIAAGELVPAMEVVGSFKENALLMGIAGGSVDESVYRSTSAMKFSEVARKAEKADKERSGQRRFIDLLAQLQQQIDQMGRELAEKYKGLQEKYGDDPISAMANRYLTPEQLDGCETDDDRLARMAEIYLDGEGSLKPGLDMDSDDLAYLQQWQARQVKLERMQTVSREAEENGMTPEAIQEVRDMTQDSSLFEARQLGTATENETLGQTVVDTDIGDTSNNRAGSTGFGLT